MSEATADTVYKCTINGKVAYQAESCASGGQALNLKVIPPDEEYLAQQRAIKEKKLNEEKNSSSNSAAKNSAYDEEARARLERNARNAQEDYKKHLIAECERNRGVRCSDPNVIRENEKLDTPITAEAQQEAARQNRARQRCAQNRFSC